MTTPQTILFDIHHRMRDLMKYFEGTFNEDTEQTDGSVIEDIKDILITVNRSMFAIDEIRDRLNYIEDKVTSSKINNMIEKLDKFEENYKRFEVMFNEFKGIVAMTWANLKASQTDT